MSWWDIIKRDKTPEEDWEELREQLPPQPKKPRAKAYTKPFLGVPPEQRDRSRGARYHSSIYRFLNDNLNIPKERAAELDFNGTKLGAMIRFGYYTALTEEEFSHIMRAQEQTDYQTSVNLLMEFLDKARERVLADNRQKAADKKAEKRELEMRRRQQNED